MTSSRKARVDDARAHLVGGARPLAFISLSSVVSVAEAQDRLIRTFDQESGLQPPIWALAQDSVGFLWVGAEGGLDRFDGAEFRRWAPDVIGNSVDIVTVSPAGTVVAVVRSCMAYAPAERIGGRATTAAEAESSRRRGHHDAGRALAGRA